jgi:hypothetical protein
MTEGETECDVVDWIDLAQKKIVKWRIEFHWLITEPSDHSLRNDSLKKRGGGGFFENFCDN